MIITPVHSNHHFITRRGGISKIKTIIAPHATHRHSLYPLFRLIHHVLSHKQLLWSSLVFLLSAPLHFTQVSSYGRPGYPTWSWLDGPSWIISGGLPNLSTGRMDHVFWKTARIWSSTSFGVYIEFTRGPLYSPRDLNSGYRRWYSTSFWISSHKCSVV